MFSTSIDVLNLVLAICIFFLTIFLCWAIYYFISLACAIRRITKKVEMGINKAEEVVDMARQKLNNSSVYFTVLGDLAKKAMEFVKTKKENKKEKTSKSKKK
jgi:undecaprenyl pyrophosphate synthase